MILHKRHSFFPLILALLTLVLIVLMFYAFTASRPDPVQTGTSLTSVSSEEYEKDLDALLQAFIEQYPQAQDDLSRLVLVEQTLQKLLSLRVPAESKEIHLNLAVELNFLQKALREKSGDEAEAFERIRGYVQN